MFRFTTKRTAIVGLVASLVVAAAAFAYFTSTGSGTGQAKVGSPASFSVTFGTTSGTMYPGAGSSSVPYTITNPGSGSENLAHTTAAVAQDSSGNILDRGTAVSGCSASWFTATDVPPTYGEIGPGLSKSGSVTVSMTDASSSQDACKNTSPDITVSAS